jgi:4'-phosphopantetheinyl transferase
VPGEVHVWKVDLGPGISAPADDDTLSADERARAARFHRAPDRARSIAARVALRTLLGEYTGVAPGMLRFANGPNGKPALAPGSPDGAPRFNVAHSGRLVLLAFATCDVGIDVEEVRPGIEVGELAGRFFSADEAAALKAAPQSGRDGLFFRIWTRKEAFLKARGSGLSSPLNNFTTTSVSGAPLASIRTAEGLPWGDLSDLEPAPGYAGGVVTEDPTRVVGLARTFASSDG